MNHLSPQAVSILNRSVQYTSNQDLFFHIHYWGMTTELFRHPVHKHSFFEVCYLIDGAVSYFEEDYGTQEFTRGTLFISRPGRRHQIIYREQTVMMFVGFEVVRESSNPDHAADYLALNELGHIAVMEQTAQVTAMLWKALWEQTEAVSSRTLLGSLAHSLLCSFRIAFLQQSIYDKQTAANAPEDRLLHQAKLFIQDNAAESLTVDNVAAYLHVSRRHLTRVFTKHGESFSDCLRKHRISKAVDLLRNTDLSVLDISQMSGFQSLHYFTNVFAKEIGLPPARYRSMAGGGIEFFDDVNTNRYKKQN